MALTQGAAGASEEFLIEGTSLIVADCAAVERSVIGYGPNLLTNGDFQSSIGTGATSAPGLGWTTAYTPAADIYAAGAGTYGLFSTNAGQVTGGAANESTVVALTGSSMAVNVSGNLAQAIISWANIYLENGKTYLFDVDVAVFNLPFGVSINVDGVVIVPIAAPAAAFTWTHIQTIFVWTGATGYHTISLNSNNAAAVGNDHAFDNFTLRQAMPATNETLTNVAYGALVKAVIDQVVKTAGCNDDRRDQILAAISSSLATGTSFVTLDSQAFVITAAAVAVTQTIAALLPASKKWVSLGFTVLSGTADFTDFDGTVISDMPAGFSIRWEAPATGILNPIQSITVDPNSRVVVTFTVK